MENTLRWVRWCVVGVIVVGVVSALGWQELRAAEHSAVLQVKSRSEVLAAIRNRSDVLINIHQRLFPATWDITLLGQRATPALRKGLLGNTRGRIRWKCAQILTQLRDASARPTLHRALRDWSDAVRGQVLRALAELGDQSSVKPILARLQDPQETLWNRTLALRALGRLGDARAIPAIMTSYTKANKKAAAAHAGQRQLRLAAVEALWALRHVAKAPMLVRVMRQALADQEHQVVRRAAIALGVYKDRKSIDAISALLAHESATLRNTAAHVLGQIGDATAIPALVKALSSVRSGRMLNNITFALQRLQDPELSRRLYGFLRHQQAFIRLNAAFAVGDMKIVHAREELEKALQDPNVIVRNQAIIALAKIGDKRSLPALAKVIQQDVGQRRWLASLAALYISGDATYRTTIWKQMLQAKAMKARRDATYALASLGDVRAAPQIYSLLLHPREYRAWKLAEKIKSPLFRAMILQRTKRQVATGQTQTLAKLFDLLGPDAAPQLTQSLLALMAGRWSRSLRRIRRYRRKNQKATAQWSRGYSGQPLLAVLRYLGLSKDPQVMPWLQGFLNHKNYHVRTEARVSLALLGDESSLAVLAAQLHNASDRHRPFLVSRLALMPKERLAQALQSHLKDPEPFLQLALAASLWRAGDVSALPLLLAALRRPQYAQRHRAYDYLAGKITPTLRTALQAAHSKETHEEAKHLLQQLLQRSLPKNPAFALFRVDQVELR